MNNYYYDAKPLKKMSVLPFLGMSAQRNKRIAAGENKLPDADNTANTLAKSLHPEYQYARVAELTGSGGARLYRLAPDVGRGTGKLAYFRAGQYVCACLEMDGVKMRCPMHICSSPKKALGADGYYLLYAAPGGAGDWIAKNWAQGGAVILSGPVGELYYERLRDAKNVVALAQDGHAAPFLSMAEAIADGTEDFSLTVLCGGAELSEGFGRAAEASGGRVKVQSISDGVFSAETIKKYAPQGEYSLFLCGDREFYKLEQPEIGKLALPERLVRREVPGDYTAPEKNADYPQEAAGKTYRLSVKVGDTIHATECRADETLMRAVEKAGIALNSRCRSGECGWCRSKLLSGQVYVPKDADGRRMADKTYGWIHPCATFPLSDVEIEVYPPVR